MDFVSSQTPHDPILKAEAASDDKDHPVRHFLAACGMNVVDFPQLRFVLELDEPQIRTGQVYLPFRLPNDIDLSYETYFRILRVSETRSSQGERRKYFEIEWNIAEKPITDREEHTAFLFLASEVGCPSCRHLFIPDVDIVDENSISLVCPQCIHHWLIKIESPNLVTRTSVSSVLENFRNDPMLMRRKLKEWENRDSTLASDEYYSYFPFEFVSNLDGWRVYPQTGNSEFEVLMKAFLNHLVREKLLAGRTSSMRTKPSASPKAELPELRWIPTGSLHRKLEKKNTFSTGFKWTVFLGLIAIFAALEFSQRQDSLSQSTAASSLIVSNTAPIVLPPVTNEIRSTPAKAGSAKLPSRNESKAENKISEKIEETFRKGMLFLKLKQGEEAIEAFQEVLSLDPQNAPSYRALGLAYVFAEQPGNAIEAFEHYLKLNHDTNEQESIAEILRTLRGPKPLTPVLRDD